MSERGLSLASKPASTHRSSRLHWSILVSGAQLQRVGVGRAVLVPNFPPLLFVSIVVVHPLS
jgi:hypothetical protein